MPGYKTIPSGCLLLIIVILFMNIPAYAEFIPLLGRDSFSEVEELLKYPPRRETDMYRVHDMDASEMESRTGIIFTGEGNSGVRINQGSPILLLSGMVMGPRCIEHVPSTEDSSEDEGIIIRFKYPVGLFGLHIGRNSYSGANVEGIDAVTLSAYSLTGELLGTTLTEREYLGNGEYRFAYSTFGFEVTGGQGATTVILDFNERYYKERIGQIYYRYLTPHPFKVIFPQIAHGISNGVSINSDLTLFWDRSAKVSIFSPRRWPLPIPILKEGNSFDLPIEEISGIPKDAPGQFCFKTTTVPGLNNLTVGYVVAESDYPIDGQVVYRTTDADGKVYEADIRGCVPETYLQIPFELNQAENLNAALAIVNPSDTVAEIEIHVNDSEGSYTEFWEPPVFTLQPGEQRARFMWELWNEMPSEDGNYILQLRSAVPFAAAAFYTRNWIVVGNLPVWSYKEGQAR